MELDTGSAVSVMSKVVYQEYLCHVPFKDTSLKLHTNTAEPVEPMGLCNVTVQYKGQSKELPIYVMENEGSTLFGRECFESIRLDWPLLRLGTSNVVPALEEVLSKHALSVFSEGLGRMKNIQARIQLKEGSRPRFWKAHPIALARKPAVDQALRELEAGGVIKKVVTSKWATPIVTPVKKDGSVRVCGDFKVTINPQLELDEYPLPRITTFTLALVEEHCSVSFTCVMPTYKWRLRNSPGHSLLSTRPTACTGTNACLMVWLQHQPSGSGLWTRSCKVFQGFSAT